MSHDLRIAGFPSFQAYGDHGLSRLGAGRGSGATAAVSAAERDVAATLNITTKEGDTLSISANFDTTATYANLRGPGYRAGAWQVTSNNSYSISVQGDLSAQEMRDISRVVRTFLHDLRAMLRGKDVSIANVAEGDPKTLASVSATADTRTTLTVAAASTGPLAEHEGGARPEVDGDETQDPVTRQLITVRAPAPQPVFVPVSEAGAAA